jgi:hypothetical protein
MTILLIGKIPINPPLSVIFPKFCIDVVQFLGIIPKLCVITLLTITILSRVNPKRATI